MAKRKTRIDIALVERGFVESGARAQALIMAGRVFRGDAPFEQKVQKAGERVFDDTPLRVNEPARFVSRGGDKLQAALTAFIERGLDVREKRCADVGASTGGFTDCLLQHGATHVDAIDVGYGQLHAKLRSDERVTVYERTNARHLTEETLSALVDLVVVDASFISIRLLLPAIARVLTASGELVALIKPQFEAGREAVTKGRGVILDEEVRGQAIAEAKLALTEHGFAIVAEIACPVHGPKGNIEQLVYARKV